MMDIVCRQDAEARIERTVEIYTDRIDAQYMRGQITTAEYGEAIAALTAWAERRYAEIVPSTALIH
jgi:hypothetical protein